MFLYAISSVKQAQMLFIGPIKQAQREPLAAVFPYLAHLAGDQAVALGFCEHFRVKDADNVMAFTVASYAAHGAATNPLSPDLGPVQEALYESGLLPYPEAAPVPQESENLAA